MLKYLIPQIARKDLPWMLAIAALGAVLAGGYGVVHDQITYTISPEYFTKLKFEQSPYADLGLGQRVYVGTIGFLATWWVGGIFAWFLARRFTPGQSRGAALRQIVASFAIILVGALLAGLLGYGYGLWRGPKADYSGWMWAADELDVVDIYAFARVAYIHNAGYLGGLLGLLVAFAVIRPSKRHRNANRHLQRLA